VLLDATRLEEELVTAVPVDMEKWLILQDLLPRVLLVQVTALEGVQRMALVTVTSAHSALDLSVRQRRAERAIQNAPSAATLMGQGLVTGPVCLAMPLILLHIPASLAVLTALLDVL